MSSPHALLKAARSLKRNGYAVIDGALGMSRASPVREEVVQLQKKGYLFHQAEANSSVFTRRVGMGISE
jgi:hypothetical protein